MAEKSSGDGGAGWGCAIGLIVIILLVQGIVAGVQAAIPFVRTHWISAVALGIAIFVVARFDFAASEMLAWFDGEPHHNFPPGKEKRAAMPSGAAKGSPKKWPASPEMDIKLESGSRFRELLHFIGGRSLVVRTDLKPGDKVTKGEDLLRSDRGSLVAAADGVVRSVDEQGITVRFKSTDLPPLRQSIYREICGTLVSVSAQKRARAKKRAAKFGVVAPAVLGLSVILAWDIHVSLLLGIGVAGGFAMACYLKLREMRSYPSENAALARLANEITIVPVDHRNEFLLEIRNNRRAERALAMFELTTSDWTLSQVRFRLQHLTGLSRAGFAKVTVAEIEDAYQVICALADRHSIQMGANEEQQRLMRPRWGALKPAAN